MHDVISACSGKRQALNPIEDIFEPTQFNVTTIDTDSVRHTTAPTLLFGECTRSPKYEMVNTLAYLK